MGKVLLSCSAGGGSGKTTFAVNLGVCLANKGSKVLILDLNMGMRNADIYLGLEDRILFDLGDVLSGLCRLEKAITEHDICKGLYLLSCPQYRSIDGFGPGHVRALYSRLGSMFDYIIVDCPVSIGPELRTAASGADAALITATADYSSVRNTEALAEKLASLGVEKLFCALNRINEAVSSDSALPSLNYITKTLNLPIVGIISENLDIHRANNCGTPVSLDQGSDIGKSFSKIAERLSNF